jgi:hypothetical protein
MKIIWKLFFHEFLFCTQILYILNVFETHINRKKDFYSTWKWMKIFHSTYTYFKCVSNAQHLYAKTMNLWKLNFIQFYLFIKCKIYDDNKYSPWMIIDLFPEVDRNHPYMNEYKWLTLFMHRCTSLKCLCANPQLQQ